MEFAIAIPQTYSDPAHIQRFLRRAEELPFNAAWCIEQVIGTAPVLESVTTLTYAAAVTKRLRLGIAVLLIAQRNPIDLAKALSSLDVLSDGRLIVGVGLGASTRHYPAYGLQPEGRVARFRENLEIMKRLWTEDKVTLDGRFSRLMSIPMQPKPVQRPHPQYGSVDMLRPRCGVQQSWETATSARARHRWMLFWMTSNSCPPTFRKQSGCIWPWETIYPACGNGSAPFTISQKWQIKLLYGDRHSRL
jgi:hypothetical protein